MLPFSVFPLNFQVLWAFLIRLCNSLNMIGQPHFWAQENGIMSPDGVCAISAARDYLGGCTKNLEKGAGDETTILMQY